MIKGLLFLLNLLGLFLCRLFFPVTVDVSQTIPASAEINKSFIVQVTINKGDLNGIGKFTEKFPAGVTAVPIDNGGSQTNFDNNTLEFSWDALPNDGVLNVSFRVDVGASASTGRDTLTGRFLYTADNQKLEADAPPSYITISGVSEAQSSGGSDTRVIDNIKQGPGGAFVIRKFPSPALQPNSNTIITLVVHKGNITGFAKIEDSLPPGFSASGVTLANASFTFVGSMAKFVWQSIPSDSIITISYRISAGPSVEGIHVVTGDFSYLYNNTPVSYLTGSTIFNTSILSSWTSALANNTSVTGGEGSKSSGSGGANRYAAADGNNNNEIGGESSYSSGGYSGRGSSKSSYSSGVGSNTYASITPSIPPPQKGVSFRVQIMALHNPVEVSYFNRSISAPVYTELHQGFTKYTTGIYKDYKTVRDARENVRGRGIAGPFVVSYNSGTRITVQEALMVTHQHWYQ